MAPGFVRGPRLFSVLVAPASALFALGILLLALKSALDAAPSWLGLLADFGSDGGLRDHGAQSPLARFAILQLAAVQVTAVEQLSVANQNADGDSAQTFEGRIVKTADVHCADPENGGGAGLVYVLTAGTAGGCEAPLHVLRANPCAAPKIDRPGRSPWLRRWRWWARWVGFRHGDDHCRMLGDDAGCEARSVDCSDDCSDDFEVDGIAFIGFFGAGRDSPDSIRS